MEEIRKPELGRPADSRLTADVIEADPRLTGVEPFDPARDVDIVDEMNARLRQLADQVASSEPELVRQLQEATQSAEELTQQLSDEKARVSSAVATAESATVQTLLAGQHVQYVVDNKAALDATVANVDELGLTLDTMTLWRVEDGQGWVQKSTAPAPWSAPRNRVKNVTLAQLQSGSLDPEGASIVEDEHGPLRVVRIADYPSANYLPEANGGTSFDIGNGLRAVRPGWRFLNVREFGAWGNGLENDSAAFRKALAAANATVGGHVAIGIPLGKYSLPDLNEVVTRENVVLIGEHEQGTRLLPKAGTMFTVRADNFGVCNLALDYGTEAAADALLFLLEGGSSKNRFQHLNINGAMRSFQIGSDLGRSNANLIQNVQFAVANSGLPTIDIYDGDGQTITDINGFVIGVLPPKGNDPMTVREGTTFIRAANKTCDTVQGSRIFLERFSRFIDIGLKAKQDGAPYYALNWQFEQVLCDYFRHEWIRFAPQGGVAAGWQFDDYYGTAWEADGLLFGGTLGFAGEMNFQNGRIMLCGRSGVKVTNPASRHNVIGTSKIYATGRLGEGGGAVEIGSGCQLDMHDSQVNFDASVYGPTWRSEYGVSIAADADHYSFQNVDAQGTAAGWQVEQNSKGSRNRRVSGNKPSASYAGKKTGVGYEIPASGQVFTNTWPWTLTVHIGGNVTAIEIDGGDIGLKQGSFELAPGSTLKPTYGAGAGTTWAVYAKA